MSNPLLFKIENGVVALDLVDTAAIGYDPAWQAPTGKEFPTVAVADYDPATAGYACQQVTGVVAATSNTTTENIDGTWCALPAVKTIQGADSWSVAWDLYQDATDPDGIVAYLYEHAGKDAYLYVGCGGDAKPVAFIGVVTLSAASIGGGRQANRSQVTFQYKNKPDGWFGTLTDWKIIPGDGSASTAGPPPLADTAATETESESESVHA
jgi:hypothetical protein